MIAGATNPGSRRSLVLERTFDASREPVFTAWTDPERMAAWWGPKGFTAPVCDIDLRPGGALCIVMRGPNGAHYPCKGVFHEIVPPERIVFTSGASEDEAGTPQLEVRTTVTFEESKGKTRLTLRAELIRATPAVAGAVAGMERGWSESFIRLSVLLSGRGAL